MWENHFEPSIYPHATLLWYLGAPHMWPATIYNSNRTKLISIRATSRSRKQSTKSEVSFGRGYVYCNVLGCLVQFCAIRIYNSKSTAASHAKLGQKMPDFLLNKQNSILSNCILGFHSAILARVCENMWPNGQGAVSRLRVLGLNPGQANMQCPWTRH